MSTETEVIRPSRAFDPMRELPPAVVEQRNWQDEVEIRLRQVEAHVRAKPIRTVGLALLAGFIVGRIVRD